MVTGGAKPQTITGASSPSAERAELHESRKVGGLMKMSPIPKLTVARGQSVMFEPGGKHVMLFGLDPKVKPGGTVRLDLKLADGSTASVDAKAVGTADGPPAGHEHNHSARSPAHPFRTASRRLGVRRRHRLGAGDAQRPPLWPVHTPR